MKGRVAVPAAGSDQDGRAHVQSAIEAKVIDASDALLTVDMLPGEAGAGAGLLPGADPDLGVRPQPRYAAGSGSLPIPELQPTPAPALPEPGARIGQYEIIRELGRGGMGAVYAARDTKLGRKVAIKLVTSNNQPELTARFIFEAQATAQCSHENIVVIHEVGEHGGNLFMVLEHLQGSPLTQLLQGGRKLPPAQAVELMVPVVRALTVAHAHNVVHRDLKPDNIFVTDSGTVKVLDFGIAKLAHGGDEEGVPSALGSGARPAAPGLRGARELTCQGAMVGTLSYMSPEQWNGTGHAIDHQTDLWAVGIILFEMVAGHHPLAPRKGWDLVITGVLQEPMPSVRAACPSLPHALADIIDRCLQKPKDRRIGSARELLEALEPMLSGRRARRMRSEEIPHIGPRSGQEPDAHRFSGRARDVAAASTGSAACRSSTASSPRSSASHASSEPASTPRAKPRASTDPGSPCAGPAARWWRWRSRSRR
jgi:eukaryotic-like serine/threonine-protein kinase